MKGIEEFDLEKALSASGSKQNGYLKVAIKPDGSWVCIPVMAVCGKEEGPVLLVDGCHHGNEYEGAEGIIRVARELDPVELKGTFIGVPALNLDAFAIGERVSPIDFSHMDLNRAYPGKSDSFITSHIAKTYMDNFVKRADYLISFHGGGNYLYLESLVAYQPPADEIGRISQKMAKAFGVEVLWRLQDLPFGGVLLQEVQKVGVSAITPEIGGQCVRHPDRWKYVEVCSTGIKNVMKSVGMLEGSLTQVGNQIDVKLVYIHSQAGGIHVPIKLPKEMVRKGEVLAKVTDVFGETVGEIKAPFDGVVIGYWSYPVIQPGNWSYLFGELLK